MSTKIIGYAFSWVHIIIKLLYMCMVCKTTTLKAVLVLNTKILSRMNGKAISEKLQTGVNHFVEEINCPGF